MAEPSTTATSVNENAYPPSYEELHQYEPSHSDTAPLLDRKVAHLNAAAAAQPRHVAVDFDGGAQASTSNNGNGRDAAVNYLYIDARSDISGEYLIDTDLAPIPGRFNSDKDRKAAENVYISVAQGASLNVKLYFQGSLPAKVTLAAHRNQKAPMPHCVEIIPLHKGSISPPLIRTVVNRSLLAGSSRPSDCHGRKEVAPCEDIVLLLPTSQSFSTAITGPIKTSEAVTSRLRCVMRNDDNPAETKHVIGELPQPPEEPVPAAATTSNEPAALSFWTFLQQQLMQPAKEEVIVCNSIRVDPHFLQNGCLLSTAQEWYHEGAMESTRTARVAVQEKDRKQTKVAAFVSIPVILFFIFAFAAMNSDDH